jgi:PAS domain S-box-containing protein
MVIADSMDRIVDVNAQAVRLFGHSRHEMVGKDVEMLIAERFRTRHRERRAKYHENPRPRRLGSEGDVFALRKDGSEFPVELSVSPLETKQGTFVVSTVRDIAARLDAAAALRASEGRYRSLLDDVLDSSSVGVCILDADMRVVWVNRAFESFFGLQRNEVVGFDGRRIVRERLHHVFEDPLRFRDRLLSAYRSNNSFEHFECHVLRDEGRDERWLEHWSQPIESGLYAGGRIEHYSDVTERKLAEERTRLFVDIARNMTSGLLVYHQEVEDDDRSLRIVSVNPATEKLLGLSKEQLQGVLVDDAFPMLRARGIPGLFADVIRTGESRAVHDFEYGDDRVLSHAWSFNAFALPGRRVGVVFEDTTRRKQAEEVIRNLAEGVAGESGVSFFRSLVIHLARSLDMEYAFVGEVVDPKLGRVRSLALCADGEVVEKVEYDLPGTPCEGVIGRKLCCYEEGVSDLFPDDSMLREMGVESYVGAPLFDSAGEPLGLIAVLGKKRLRDRETAASVLRIFAARAAAEMERQRAARSR